VQPLRARSSRKPSKARECFRSRAAICCCARSVEMTSMDTCNTLRATYPVSGAGRRTTTSPRRSCSMLSWRSSRLTRAWSSRRCHTCSSRSLSRPSARTVRRTWLISCTLGTSRSSRGDRCRDDRSPAAAHARTVFSLSPRIFAAMTGRTLPSSARASRETASSFARRSSPSGSVLATSSMASTRSNRLRMRCSSVATDKAPPSHDPDASDYRPDSRNPPLRREWMSGILETKAPTALRRSQCTRDRPW
jgi:hypothetical protein